MYTKNFTSIPGDTRVAICQELSRAINATPILISRESNHPNDDYLYVYIAQRNDSYVVGVANTSRRGSVDLYENHYNVSFKQALEIAAEKIYDLN